MLSQKGLLVCLSISQWTARKQDGKANATVRAAHAVTSRDAVNTFKNLLPDSPELKKVRTLAGDIRTFFYANTVPWQHGGMHMINSSYFMDFTQDFNRLKREFDSAVEAFLVEYPRLRDLARVSLGDLFNELEYPTPANLPHAFGVSVQVFPVPDVGDFRIELPEAEKESFINNLKTVESNAMLECWERLHNVVKNAAEKLSQPDGIFRDTLISNITDMCQILPRLNVTDDPALEQARREVEALAAKLSPDVCRDNPSERQDAASKLKDIQAKMSGLMGGI